MIIGLVGEKLAGKDTAANYLVQKYGAGHFRFTHVLDDILNILNLPVSRRNEIDLGLGLREIFGNHVLVNALEKRMRESKSEMSVINGIRMDEFSVIKQWPGAKIIYLTAPSEVRFKRYQTRREKADDGLMDFEAFVKQDHTEATEVDIPKLGAKADYKIENTASVEELYQKIDEVIKQIK